MDGFVGAENLAQQFVETRLSLIGEFINQPFTARAACAASASVPVMLIGKVRSFEVEHGGGSAVPHAFIQRSGQAAQPFAASLRYRARYWWRMSIS